MPKPATARTRWQVLGPALLALSVAARLGWSFLTPNGANFVDLHVYVGGAATLGTQYRLYDYVYADQTPDFPLPFTYPPFAAIVFYPLHWLPFGLVEVAWQFGTIAALYGVVRLSQRLAGGSDRPGDRAVGMAWTAVGIWMEPMRSTLDYGQINVILVLAVLYAVYNTRWWISGLLVGLAAGIKLTPAVSGLYFLGTRRFGTVAFSALTFLGTVALSIVLIGEQARYYFTDLLGDPHRIGPMETSFNQSWRGGISRILGHDAGVDEVAAFGGTATDEVLEVARRIVEALREQGLTTREAHVRLRQMDPFDRIDGFWRS